MTMKVPILSGVKSITWQEKPIPAIGPDEALVKVAFCGLCGSDLHAYVKEGIMPAGTLMGHECAGIVADVGAAVSHVHVGDRVWVKPGATCGQCYWCKKGQYMRCPEALNRAIGLTPACDGAFAPYVKIDHPADMLFPLPAQVSFEEAALVEPLSVALHGVRLSQFKVGDSVVIAGAGMIGLGVLQFIKLGGAGRIFVLETSESRASMARQLGADVVLNPVVEGDTLAKQILDLTQGIGAEVVFECSGAPSALKGAIDYVSSGGQIMVIGLHEGTVAFDFWQLLHREIDVKGSLGFLDEFKTVIGFFEGKKLSAQPFITDEIELDEIDEKGFERLLSSDDMIKILVKPSSEQ